MAYTSNRRVLLASRPQGAPSPANFRLEEAAVPVPGEGQVLLHNLYLSLDPYMRGRMNDGHSYAEPFEIGEPMGGATVSRVEASRHTNFAEGDIVLGFSGWQELALSDGKGLSKLNAAAIPHLSYALGVLGMTGFTAWHGLLKIGEPKAGETVVVAAASGAVGSVVGQIAKLKGCRTVGIAGGEAKCRYVVEELGFDACVNRRAPDLKAALKAAVPAGIDIYFENVGGPVFDAVLPLLNLHARVPVCGIIAHYNDSGTEAKQLTGSVQLSHLVGMLVRNRIRMQGFLIMDYYDTDFAEFQRQMSKWVFEGKVKGTEDFTDGLENAAKAFIGMLEGKNFGKSIVRIAKDY